MRCKLVILPLILFFAGCASHVSVERYVATSYEPTTHVEVFRASEPTHSYTKIAAISVERDEPKAIDIFTTYAKALGANGILLMGNREGVGLRVRIGSHTMKKKRPEVWAVAIRYETEPAVREALFQHDVGEDLIEPDSFVDRTRPVRKRNSFASPPAKKLSSESPIRVEETRPALGEPGVIRKMKEKPVRPVHPDKVYYSVVESRKLFKTEKWLATTHVKVVTRTPNEEACFRELESDPTKDKIFARCFQADEHYERLFKNQSIDEWYVTIRLKGAYPGAAIVGFGSKYSHDGKELRWEESQKLEVIESFAQGMVSEAREKGVIANVRAFSPNGELAL